MKAEYDFSQAKRGPALDPTGKTRITICLDDEILAAFRARAQESGQGYQTLINAALRQVLTPDSAPLTAATLRQVLREELHPAA